MKTIYQYFIYTISCLLLLSSGGCSVEEQPALPAGPVPLAINMTICNKATASTRAIRQDIEDQWSYISFTQGDAMGFFASGGNWLDDTNGGAFDNYELVYDGNSQFKSSDGSSSLFSPSDMNGKEVYMYFPYDSKISETGMELRVHPDETSEEWRCIDYLAANYINMEREIGNDKYALFGEFLHGFSELIIMRGKGFDNPPVGKERITAVISEGCTHIKIDFNMENGWSCVPKLIYSNSANCSYEDSKKWDAWKGGNYGKTQEDPVGKEAWYVIVPTLGTGDERTNVEYIELYDNDGNLQQVTGLKLSGADNGNPTKYVDPGWRYPMEITMNELVPSVNPFPIEPWGKPIDLTDQRTRGINNAAEFKDWVRDYNTYLNDTEDEEKSDKLLKYGDRIVDGNSGEVTWHFYLLSDIDLSNYNPLPWTNRNGDEVTPSTETIIPNLKDILDGKSTTLVNSRFINHKITGLNKTFISLLTQTGKVQNLDFIEPSVINPDDSSKAAGILILNIDGGTVDNCNIKEGRLVNPSGPGGMIAGYMKGGAIRNCTLSGFLYAASTAETIEAKKIVGEIDALVVQEFENNDVSDVIP